jgi:hypothetical protein
VANLKKLKHLLVAVCRGFDHVVNVKSINTSLLLFDRVANLKKLTHLLVAV